MPIVCEGMNKQRNIKFIGKADEVSLGPDTVQQALPLKHIEQVDPFLLLHHFNKDIEPGGPALDVAPHPHRGFEPVTFLFEGEIRHRDSRGNEGYLKSGDVQWMTAGMGIVHSEAADKEWVAEGGKMNLIQLWVNLPKRDKMMQPAYQDIKSENIPVYDNHEGFTARVVAGTFNDLTGPAATRTPLNAVHGKLEKGKEVNLPVEKNHSALVYVLDGFLEFNDKHQASSGFIAIFENEGDLLNIKAKQDTAFLLLTGEPINEPMATYGPFVMNNQTEIMEAIRDYQTGKMGMLTY